MGADGVESVSKFGGYYERENRKTKRVGKKIK